MDLAGSSVTHLVGGRVQAVPDDGRAVPRADVRHVRILHRAAPHTTLHHHRRRVISSLLHHPTETARAPRTQRLNERTGIIYIFKRFQPHNYDEPACTYWTVVRA
ncbi:hypothetical protein EVAR_78931_1 [Eumeta japonica]|uniref:Uncharacterized protein n=1 Tax=Eumeta variegata TaxID=151549 RepID=A0A4C1U2L3_EUMVA|nr:hypothetical protein EVAR_78931_1 [Eumeta japonica]